MAQGASHSDAAAVQHNAIAARVSIGGATRRPETPAARRAVISPSADMRLRVISVPTRTPSGIEYGKACGKTSANRYATVEAELALRTRIANRGPARCMNTTNVKRSVPRNALTAISRKMTRLNLRGIKKKSEDRSQESE